MIDFEIQSLHVDDKGLTALEVLNLGYPKAGIGGCRLALRRARPLTKKRHPLVNDSFSSFREPRMPKLDQRRQ